MLTRKTRPASRLTLALGGLVIAATVSAADVQSQAQGVLTGHRPSHVAAFEAAPAISGPASPPRVDAQLQAAGILLGQSRTSANQHPPGSRSAHREHRSLGTVGS